MVVQVCGVSKWYGRQSRILDQVNLQLKKGDFIYVVGGSGAGKTTLLSMLATEDSPSQGKISIFGYDPAKASSTTLEAIRRSIGYVPQNIRLIPDLSVKENLVLSLSVGGSRFGGAEATKRVNDLLAVLGLTSRRDNQVRDLSGGEAQRVAVARALVRLPELIIADEPTGAQDRDFSWAVMDLLLKANQAGSTVIVATHDREIVRRVRKRCAILKGGRISLEESPCFF